jgi:hypothetical protein
MALMRVRASPRFAKENLNVTAQFGDYMTQRRELGQRTSTGLGGDGAAWLIEASSLS